MLKSLRITATCITNTGKFLLSSRNYLVRSITNLAQTCSEIVGADNVSESPSVLEQHSHDESFHRGELPILVVWPQSVSQVSEIVRACSVAKIAIVPYGTGTGLEGGVTAVKDSICIDLTKMDSITDMHLEDFDITVQPGVTRKALNHHVKDYGVWFPIDPGADASLCGMAATGASGTNAVRYGTMKENVLNLEVVMPDGKVIHTAGKGRRFKKSSAGLNLTNLFVGSEGTLGLITSATLRLHAIPESMRSAVCSFPTAEDAINCTVSVIQAGIPIARIEYLDERSIMAANKFSNLSNPVKPSLFLEFHGSESGTKEQVRIVEELALSCNGSDFKWASAQEDRNKLWKARHDLLYALLALAPGCKAYSTDACVPISKLPECITYTREVAAATGIPYGIVGHVGDGNLHCLFTLDPSSDEDIQKVKDAAEKIARNSLALGGTCTGEHGVGLGKKKFLLEEFEGGVDVMKSIKHAFDPHNLMNPGKVF